MPRLNTELLRRIADEIERTPAAYDQGLWFCSPGAWNNSPSPRGIPFTPTVTECGTKACIAGFALWLTPPERRPEGKGVIDSAQELLGLSDHETDVLFDGGWLPEELSVPDELRRIADQDFVDIPDEEEDEDEIDEDDDL